MGEHRPYKPRVTGSSPVPPTTYSYCYEFVDVVQFWLERPVNPDGKVARLDLLIKFLNIKK